MKAFLLAIAVVLGVAPGAQAAMSTDSAGYVTQGKGIHFRQVNAFWKLPAVSCKAPNRSYSAMWIGIGGYGSAATPSTSAAEIGTEADCSYTGREVTSAWFAVLPGKSTSLKLATAPGDVVSGSVALSGHAITFTLQDAGARVVRSVRVKSVDDSTAEWVLGPPSACISATACQALTLANFGSAAFGIAYAKSSTGHSGSISDRTWHSTPVSLVPLGARTVTAAAGAPFLAGAIPSRLGAAGTAFTIAYRKLGIGSDPFA